MKEIYEVSDDYLNSQLKYLKLLSKQYSTISKASAEIIGFYDIPYYIEKTLDCHKNRVNPTLEDILEVDKETRAFLANLLK